MRRCERLTFVQTVPIHENSTMKTFLGYKTAGNVSSDAAAYLKQSKHYGARVYPLL
jgi:hypothetical protein